MEKVYLVYAVKIIFYRGDGNQLKVWEETKGIFSSKTKANIFIESIKDRYERVDIVIKEIELDKELVDYCIKL
ncbi:MAG: hypothetical protein PHO12_07860 [Bacteroidales bacterium]|nr:hypothetical protein [Bacteroidales bacterium]MDD4685120.1 hypothetical protein [Bacteroidales bacterium]